MKRFVDAVREAPLLLDGAMGSLLYERGVFFTRSFDELNLSSPELITQVHREYVDAGADVIETNTFGANRIALGKHGHADKVVAINQAAVKLARAAAQGREVHVAGAVGPTGVDYGAASAAEQALADASLEEQIGTLHAAGVDVILLETFSDLAELEFRDPDRPAHL